MMGDVAKGLKSFKKGMTEDEACRPNPRHRRIEGDAPSDTAAVERAAEPSELPASRRTGEP
jgi:hypothetical protein